MKFPFFNKRTTPALKIPEHVAIIMDGNGRWAQARGLPREAGHRMGANSVRDIVKSCGQLGIKYVTLYAFSSENWSRPEKEVSTLMLLLEKFLKERLPEMLKSHVRLRAIGRLDKLPKSVRDELNKAIKLTEENGPDKEGKSVTLTLALSYGGREEIVDATKSIVSKVQSGEIAIDDIDNTLFSSQLYTSDTPDPDLLIRTSGEVRLSNFLLWQLSYAEIVISAKNWPDFRHKEFVKCLEEYSRRDRRFGKVSPCEKS